MNIRLILAACLLAAFTLHADSLKAQPKGFEKPLDPAEAAKRESKFLANITQLTDIGKSGEGYFSPDQKSIIYQSIRGKHPFYQIFVRNLETGKDQLVSTGFGRTTCAYFHPTKKRIMFASSHLDPNRDKEVDDELKRLAELRRNPGRRSYSWAFDPFMDIFETDLDGKNAKALTKAAGYDAEGSWSPDGKQIIFCSFRNGGNGDIYIMDADGSDVRQLTDSPGYDGGPFFSPDGKHIIFRGEVRQRKYLQVFVMPVDGKPGDEIQLTDNGAVNWGPYWHPDGKHILWSNSLHGHHNYELYWMNVITRKSERVTWTGGADILPVFSPDGKKLMWTSTRGKDREGNQISQLFIADWIYKGE